MVIFYGLDHFVKSAVVGFTHFAQLAETGLLKL